MIRIFKRIRNLIQRIINLIWIEDRVNVLKENLDLLKSSLEISGKDIEDFKNWQKVNIVSKNPLVSICIGTYNRGKILCDRTIPSILAQSYDNFELIIVGDKCIDDTEELISKISDSRIRFINLEERGPYPDDPILKWMVAGTAPVNKALELAKGEYITHLDDDDEYLPERIENLVQFSDETNADFIWHPYWYEYKKNKWELKLAEKYEYGQLTTSSIFYKSWFKRIKWDINSYLLKEPGDWGRLRKIKYLNPNLYRYPEPLVKHYMQVKQQGY